MRGTWYIGISPFGIPILINWSFLLWTLFVLPMGIWKGTCFIMTMVISLLVHEFSHALVAKKLGYLTQSITLYMFGGVARGVARIFGLPDADQKHEIPIAFAGPASSLALALFGFLVSQQFSNPPWGICFFATVNAMLGVFNMLPLFPMDGGRILRAVLSVAVGMEKATTISSTITIVVGASLGILSFAIGYFWVALVLFSISAEAIIERRIMRRGR